VSVRRTARLVAGAAACILGGLTGPSITGSVVPAGAATSPTASASTEVASPGQLVHITGAGWEPIGGVVTVQICGQDAQNLSNDCDETNTYSAAIRSAGIFYAALFVRIPPTPCPCVFYVTSHSGQSTTVPVQIVGAQVVPIAPTAAPKEPVILSATLQTPLSVSSWVGGPKRDTLDLRITNVSGSDLPAVVVSVLVGRGEHPTALVGGGTQPLLPAGSRRLVQIPFTIPAITYGHYTVVVKVATSEGNVDTSLQTSSWPWVWFVLIVEIFLISLVMIVRRRRQASQPSPEGGPPTSGSPLVPSESDEQVPASVP
jgi:hypothetical protein